ncbi:MAG: hypothetical protein M3033_09450 [Acidobacteriota bacterium]|nr:hypothetical protein [Acidobacteriota bacterium]
MKFVATSLLLILLFSLSNFSQKRISQNIRLNENQPSVYITFERYIKSKDNNADEDFALLRFKNNTRWSVLLNMSEAAGKEFGDASLFYEVKNNKGELLENHSCHVCSFNYLGSGKALLFAVPHEYLKHDQKIQIEFGYEWQDSDDVFAGREVSNLVTFFGNSLPKENK